jgi:hypothetical protein
MRSRKAPAIPPCSVLRSPGASAHRCRAVQHAHVRFGRVQPLKFLGHHLLEVVRHAWKILRFQVELRQYILHGNAQSTAFGEPSQALMQTPSVLFGHRLVISRRRDRSAGYRIEQHEFEKSDGSGKLGGGQPFYELVCVLLFR